MHFLGHKNSLCDEKGVPSFSKPDQYRFCWYLPLSRLKLRWVAEQSSPDELQRLHSIRTRMYLLRQYLEQHGTVRLRDRDAR